MRICNVNFIVFGNLEFMNFKIKNNNLTSRTINKGFTLVETVLALGIVATVMVTLMALLPTGMDIMKEAGTNTVGARIANQLVSEIQLSDYEKIQQWNGKEYYFDDMGTELTKNDQESKNRRIYTARIEVDEKSPELPGKYENKYLKRVVVKVAGYIGGAEPDFSDPPSDGDPNKKVKKDYHSYWTYIVDTQKDSRD